MEKGKRGKWDCNPGAGCQGVAGQPLRRSREGTRELGSGAKPWSQGDRARYGAPGMAPAPRLEQKLPLEAQEGMGTLRAELGCGVTGDVGDGVPGTGLAWHCWDTPGIPITCATRTCRGW